MRVFLAVVVAVGLCAAQFEPPTLSVALLPTTQAAETPALPAMPTAADGTPFRSPVQNMSKISNTFAPRWKYSQSRYDYHRGIDFWGTLGETITAAAPGTVFKNEFTSGGV